MIRQVSYTYIGTQLRTFLFISLIFIFSSCSLNENLTDIPGITPSLPTKSTNSPENTSAIKIKQIEKTSESTDVEISISYSVTNSEFINIKYGKEPNNLISSKKIPTSEVYSVKQLDDTIFGRIRLKDIGAIEPLYVSIAIINKEGIESEYSEAFLVTGEIKPKGLIKVTPLTDSVSSVSSGEKQVEQTK